MNDVFRLTPIATWRSHVRALAECVARRGCHRVVFSAVPSGNSRAKDSLASGGAPGAVGASV